MYPVVSYPDAALAVLHVSTGLFFTTSGARKLFLSDVHKKVAGLFSHLGVGGKFVEWAVPTGEFLGGLGLFFGVLVQPAAAGLLLIMFGAYKLDTWPGVKAKQTASSHWSQLVSNALCNPEAQLIFILIALLLAGGGRYSLVG